MHACVCVFCLSLLSPFCFSFIECVYLWNVYYIHTLSILYRRQNSVYVCVSGVAKYFWHVWLFFDLHWLLSLLTECNEFENKKVKTHAWHATQRNTKTKTKLSIWPPFNSTKVDIETFEFGSMQSIWIMHTHTQHLKLHLIDLLISIDILSSFWYCCFCAIAISKRF